jgi:SAM-dependent methyltransferase
MHPVTFNYLNSLLEKESVGEDILEIGAVLAPHSLLNLPVFKDSKHLIGINLNRSGSYPINAGGTHNPYNHFTVVEGNANHMDCFEENKFDTIVCNAVFEHDKFFWRTVQEIRRVGKPGALVLIGVPGYDEPKNIQLQTSADTLRYQLNFGSRSLLNRLGHLADKLFPGTLTVPIHNCPGDYYRFSPQAMKQVIFEGMQDVKVFSIQVPPRIIGIGYLSK